MKAIETLEGADAAAFQAAIAPHVDTVIEGLGVVSAAAVLVRGQAAVAARQGVWILARTAGDVAIELAAGGSVTVPVQPGRTALSLAATRHLLAGSTADADVWSLTAPGAPFAQAQALPLGGAAIDGGAGVLINCRLGGTAVFALAGGGQLPCAINPGLNLFSLSAVQLVAAGTTADLSAWSLTR